VATLPSSSLKVEGAKVDSKRKAVEGSWPPTSRPCAGLIVACYSILPEFCYCSGPRRAALLLPHIRVWRNKQTKLLIGGYLIGLV